MAWDLASCEEHPAFRQLRTSQHPRDHPKTLPLGPSFSVTSTLAVCNTRSVGPAHMPARTTRPRRLAIACGFILCMPTFCTCASSAASWGHRPCKRHIIVGSRICAGTEHNTPPAPARHAMRARTPCNRQQQSPEGCKRTRDWLPVGGPPATPRIATAASCAPPPLTSAPAPGCPHLHSAAPRLSPTPPSAQSTACNAINRSPRHPCAIDRPAAIDRSPTRSAPRAKRIRLSHAC